MLGELSGVAKIYLVSGYTYMRRSIDGLMAIVRDAYEKQYINKMQSANFNRLHFYYDIFALTRLFYYELFSQICFTFSFYGERLSSSSYHFLSISIIGISPSTISYCFLIDILYTFLMLISFVFLFLMSILLS